jgi:endoglucanase
MFGVIIGLVIAIAFGVGLILGRGSGKSADGGTAVAVELSAVEASGNGNSHVNATVSETAAGTANEGGTSASATIATGGTGEAATGGEGTAADTRTVALDAVVTAERSNHWGENGNYYAQFDITVRNNGLDELDGWVMEVSADGLKEITQAWNCEASSSDGTYIVTPVQYNQKLASGSETAGMGIIINSGKELENIDVKVMVGGSTVSSGTQGGTGGTSGSSDSVIAISAGKSSASSNASGKLHVSGTSLMDGSGNAVQLRGVSTHGLAWYPEYVNKAAFQTLRDDWGANVIRLAMYTDEYGGYCNGGDRDKLKQLVDDGVGYATELGMYVIIDWHILNDNNPQTHKSDAIEFFDEMTRKYADHDNVIYEICNEPHGVSWSNDIKPYAQEVLKVIRSNTDAVVLVGTNTWSQDVDDVIGNALDYDNVMYVAHFYAATHKEAIREKITKAMAAGVPVFVSECSICDASGNGSIDEDSANKWLSFMNENGISFVAWSLSNKNETSALIKSDCSKTSGWGDDDLSQCGKWFKKAIKGDY